MKTIRLIGGVRKVSISIAVVLLLLSLTACESGYEITTNKIPLSLGDSTINLVLHDTSISGLTYLNLHDDENTGVQAALDIIKKFGGQVFELRHSGRRNITFKLDGVEYEFDPNRMFTDTGLTDSLERFGPVSDEAVAAVRSFANDLLEQVKPFELQVMVTLHNNDGIFSIESYAAAGLYEADAQQVSINNEKDPNDFYFVTENDIFDYLAQLEQNVVLQDNVNVTDDGSLSVWCGSHQIPYVNTEVQIGHRRTHSEMLQLIQGLYFPESGTGTP